MPQQYTPDIQELNILIMTLITRLNDSHNQRWLESSEGQRWLADLRFRLDDADPIYRAAMDDWADAEMERHLPCHGYNWEDAA